jgi:hypothetical protein
MGFCWWRVLLFASAGAWFADVHRRGRRWQQPRAAVVSGSLRTRHTSHATRHFFPRPVLRVVRARRSFNFVTAAEIIAEIEHLPADERAKVVAFAQHLGESAMLSGAELSKLAGRLADGPHPAEAARLREEIEKGFYGASSHA